MQADTEPNGDFFTGQELGEQACGEPAAIVNGTSLNTTDVDVFTYDGTWDCGNSNEPDHVVTISGEVEVCLFPVCPSSESQVFCVAGDTTTIDGFSGCCGTDSIVADVNCIATADESTTGYISVVALEKESECVEYSLTYAVNDA